MHTEIDRYRSTSTWMCTVLHGYWASVKVIKKKTHPFIIKREDMLRLASARPCFLHSWQDWLEMLTKLYCTDAWWVLLQTFHTDVLVCGRSLPTRLLQPSLSLYSLEFCGQFFPLAFFQLTSCTPKEGVSGMHCTRVKNLWINALIFVSLFKLSLGKGWTIHLEMIFYKEFHSSVNMPCGKKMKYQLLP